tara:strand:+ start:1878 stop:2123 length:246 start_codon:yes stop_codon:yes gene_type:complete
MKNFNNLPLSETKLDNLFKVIEEKIVFDKIHSFELLNYVFDKVDEFFKEYDPKCRDILIMKIYDNIEIISNEFELTNIVHF